MPVTRDLVDTAIVGGTAGHGVRCILIDFKNARQHDWPVIVIELVGEEERAGKAVILRTVVAVVLVGGNGVASETVVRIHVRRQPVVMAEQDRLTITALNQIRRKCAVKGPHRVRLLRGEAGMELQRNRRCRINSAVEFRVDVRPIVYVGLSLRLRGLNSDLGQELIEALMRPDGSRRTAFNGASQAGLSAYEGRIQWLLGLVGLGLRHWGQTAGQWIWYPWCHVKPRHRRSERLYAERWAGRSASGNSTAAAANAAGGIGATNKGVQAVNGSQKAASRNQAPFHQFTTGNFACGESLENFCPVFPRIFGFPDSCFGGFCR